VAVSMGDGLFHIGDDAPQPEWPSPEFEPEEEEEGSHWKR